MQSKSQHSSQQETHQASWHLVTIEEIGLKPPTIRRLLGAGFETVADLQHTTRKRLRNIYQFGAGKMADVDAAFDRLGLPRIPYQVKSRSIGRKC